jgi:hypothetical protein
MTLNQAQFEFTRDVAYLINYLYTKGYTVTLGEARRTKEQQEIYLKTGKSKTINSRHLIGLAIDLNLFKDGKYLPDTKDYKDAAEFWVKLNADNVAGYFWGWDGNHFERKPPTTPPRKS